MPYFDSKELPIHYAKHGGEFAALTHAEYERLANQFLTVPLRPGLMECTRKKGDIVRYDTASEEYGVLSAGGLIRTYFKPRPCASLPSGVPKIGCHGFPDNIQYFRAMCATW